MLTQKIISKITTIATTIDSLSLDGFEKDISATNISITTTKRYRIKQLTGLTRKKYS